MARTTTLARLSVQDLQAEIRRRARSAGPLQRRREQLLKRLAEIDAELQALGQLVDSQGSIRVPGHRRRAVNETPLPEALHKVLQGKTMAVGEIADAVQTAGYKTYSSNFKIMVNMVLTKYPKMFKRVARGQYTAK